MISNLHKLFGQRGKVSISLNAGGWTTNPPAIGAGTIPGFLNDIRITFNAADWTGATVSWMFMGSS